MLYQRSGQFVLAVPALHWEVTVQPVQVAQIGLQVVLPWGSNGSSVWTWLYKWHLVFAPAFNVHVRHIFVFVCGWSSS